MNSNGGAFLEVRLLVGKKPVQKKSKDSLLLLLNSVREVALSVLGLPTEKWDRLP